MSAESAEKKKQSIKDTVSTFHEALFLYLETKEVLLADRDYFLVNALVEKLERRVQKIMESE